MPAALAMGPCDRAIQSAIGMPNSATSAVAMVALSTEVQQRRPQARGLEAAVAWLSEPDDEGDERDGQVQRQQPAQPGERAAGRSISHY